MRCQRTALRLPVYNEAFRGVIRPCLQRNPQQFSDYVLFMFCYSEDLTATKSRHLLRSDGWQRAGTCGAVGIALVSGDKKPGAGHAVNSCRETLLRHEPIQILEHHLERVLLAGQPSALLGHPREFLAHF